jgi:predicted ATPase
VFAQTGVAASPAQGDATARILTPDQRLRVFISSTLQELAAERAAASEAVAALRLTPVLFELGARPHPPSALYRAYLAQSQLFVGVYWQSYGWVAPGESISGIEDEFLRSEGLPRLVYVKHPAPDREERLQVFLERMQVEGTVSYRRFGTADELRELLARDLALVLTERFQATAVPIEEPPAPARSLPTPRTSFVGRDAELEEIDQLLDAGARLLTLPGPAGIGTTRLAVEAASRLAGGYRDGVVFVPLDGLAGADGVPAAIAEALGVLDLRGNAEAAVKEFVRRRRLLLVFDNFEHVIPAAESVAALLDAAPDLTALVTSRELLRLSGEHELQVGPLSVDEEAVVLFSARAAAARHAFELAPEDVSIVAEICRRLDGVPLAIELAAPRMRLLTPAQLLERLGKRLELSGPRDAPARQRTLEAAIAWSYELLVESERLLFERLAVFHGSFTIEAAEAVAALHEGLDLVDALSSLLDKSIVYRLPHLGETRFAMLRMIREFALERLAERGEREAALERFQAYYLGLARGAEDGLRVASQRQWRRALDVEADNWHAALARAVEQQRAEEVAALMRGLWVWFWLHGNLGEGSEWLGQGLACADGARAGDRGWLLGLAGGFSVLGAELQVAIERLATAESLLAEAGDRRGALTMSLFQSFAIAAVEGEERARVRLEGKLAEFEEIGDLWGVGTSLHAMTRLRVVFGNYEGAGDLFERAVAALEQTGDELGVVLASHNLAMARVTHGDVAGARAVMERVLELRHAEGISFGADDALDILARIRRAEGEPEHAIALLAAADGIRERIHIPLWPPAAGAARTTPGGAT